FITVFHDDGGVDAQAPFMTHSFGDCAGAWDYDGVPRNDQGQVGGCAANCAVDEVEYRGASCEDGSGGENCALTDNGPFVDSAIATDEHFVLDDDRAGVDGLKDAADLRCGAEVDALTDLGAGSDEGVRIDHRSL